MTDKTQRDRLLRFVFGIILWLIGFYEPFNQLMSFDSTESDVPTWPLILLFVFYVSLLVQFHPFLTFRSAFIRSVIIAQLSRYSYSKHLYGILEEKFFINEWFIVRQLVERKLREEILSQNLKNQVFWESLIERFSMSIVFNEFWDNRRLERVKTLEIGFFQRLARRWKKFLNGNKKNVYLVPFPERISISERIEKWCWSDGFSLYVRRGDTFMPTRYGSVPVSEWKSQWLLEEENAQMRSFLIREIGWEKIVEELQSNEIDTWKEYQLITIPNLELEDEEVRLLKMICPSTGHIHVLRVPPDISSAKNAITWCNWGIAPEYFTNQT